MIQRFDVGVRMSEVAVIGGTVYLAGQVAHDASEDIEGQTRQVLAAIDVLLERAGTDKTRILMAQIFLVPRPQIGVERGTMARSPTARPLSREKLVRRSRLTVVMIL